MQNCGTCTLCCKLPQIPSVESPIGVYCKHCVPDVGCKIYHVRPEECREFQCMWSQMEYAGVEMRPDKCHIVFEKVTDNIIFGRLDDGYILSPLVLGQLHAFRNEGFSVLIFRGEESICFLAEGHTEEYVRGVVNDRS